MLLFVRPLGSTGQKAAEPSPGGAEPQEPEDGKGNHDTLQVCPPSASRLLSVTCWGLPAGQHYRNKKWSSTAPKCDRH